VDLVHRQGARVAIPRPSRHPVANEAPDVLHVAPVLQHPLTQFQQHGQEYLAHLVYTVLPDEVDEPAKTVKLQRLIFISSSPNKYPGKNTKRKTRKKKIDFHFTVQMKLRLM
jgi:hypothetical protein